MADEKESRDGPLPVFAEFSQPLAQPRPMPDAVYRSGPSGPLPLGETSGPGPSHQVALEARTTVMSAGTGAFTISGNDAELTVTRSQPVIVGRSVIANRAAIYFQAVGLEMQLQDRLAKAREERSNSESVEELEAICVSVKNLRIALSAETSLDEAEIGAHALSIKDGVLEWWAQDHVTIMDAAYNTALFAGCLGLICAFGIVPAVVAGTIVRGKLVGDALKAGVDFLKSLGLGR